jgi:hypothetical protein
VVKLSARETDHSLSFNAKVQKTYIRYPLSHHDMMLNQVQEIRCLINSQNGSIHGTSSLILIFPTALSSGVYTASNRKEYQKERSNVSEE